MGERSKQCRWEQRETAKKQAGIGGAAGRTCRHLYENKPIQIHSHGLYT